MQRSEIKFEKGSILRKEMLADMYEYPRFIMENYYESYGDGILYGLEWKEHPKLSGHHVITPGALKFRGSIYFQTDSIDVEEFFREKMVDSFYKLFFIEKSFPEKEPSRKIYEMQLTAVQSEKYEDSEKRGFYYAYVSYNGAEEGFEQIEDEEHLYGLYAGNDMYGYRIPSAAMEKRILSILNHKERKQPLDYMLLQKIYEKKSLHVRTALLYLQEYYGEIQKDIDVLPELSRKPKQLLSALEEACEKFQCKYFMERRMPDAAPKSEESGMIIRDQGAL